MGVGKGTGLEVSGYVRGPSDESQVSPTTKRRLTKSEWKGNSGAMRATAIGFVLRNKVEHGSGLSFLVARKLKTGQTR